MKNKDKQNKMRKILVYLTILNILALLTRAFLSYMLPDEPEEITYNEFRELLDEGRVESIKYGEKNEYMTVTVKNGIDGEENVTCLYPGYEDFRKEMLEKSVKLKVTSSESAIESVLRIMFSAFPLLILLAMVLEMKNRTGMSKESLMVQTSSVKFSDVIGQDEVLEDVKFVTSLLKNNSLGRDIGVSVPKGILFEGPPGTGKTLIAKAIAGEAGVNFLSINSSSLIELYVGVGAKRVREVFQTAKKAAPCIVFFDEIDAIGTSRNGRKTNTENEQTINALLQEMDGFTGRNGVFVIAATNRGDKLDSALTRAGRFDRRISIGPPRDWTVRRDLFNFFLKGKKVDESVDTEKIAKQTGGFTGADIEAVCNEAGIVAIMEEKQAIDMDCVEKAIDKKVFHGSRSKRQQFDKDRQVVAYHEAGHAVAHFLYEEPIARATIAGTVSGVGGVVFGEDKNTQFRTKEYYENRVKICYAGRVAEELKFNFVTQGASSDISQATEMLYEYVSNLGFSEEFGMVNLDVLSEKQIIDKSNSFELIQETSKHLYEEVKREIGAKFFLVEEVAKKLLEKETLTGDEIASILKICNCNNVAVEQI